MPPVPLPGAYPGISPPTPPARPLRQKCRDRARHHGVSSRGARPSADATPLAQGLTDPT